MKNNPWVWISALALVVVGALIFSSEDRRATPTGRTLGSGSADGGAYLRSVAATLNDLGGNVDLELQPAQPILTASSSTDGNEVRATVTENPNAPDGIINYLLASDANANFLSVGVEPGDVIRYYVNMDAESAERGLEQRTALQLAVRRLDARDPENALILEVPLNGPSLTPERIEIWRYSDKRMDAIRSALNRYVNLRLPPAGWEPAPDLGALQQVIERANQWFRTKPAADDWKREPLLVDVVAELPVPSTDPEKRAAASLEKAISSENLRDGVFADWEGRLLAQAIWARDVAQWTRGSATNDAEVADALFDWTVRNIQLDSPDAPQIIYQPWQALIYGHGSAADRAWVFIELLRQQRIDAAIIRPVVEGEQSTAPLLVGALIDDQVRLFDPQLGLPLPGTLAELAEDDSLLRQLDVAGEFTYGATAEQMKNVEARIVASPLQLARRSALLEGGLEGEDFVKLSVDPKPLADRLAKFPQIKSVKLWTKPFLSHLGEQTIDIDARRKAAAEFAPLAERPLLWKARVLHFQGNKDVRAEERNDPLAEPRQGHQDALKLYQDPTVRPANATLAKLEPEKRAIYAAAKAAASNWLGLLSYDRGNYDVAQSWLGDRNLDQGGQGRWANGARYNLARTHEALGQTDEAVKLLEADPPTAPQRHGNLLRARRLQAAAAPDTQ